MRIKQLMDDTLYFKKNFPLGNYHCKAKGSANKLPNELESYLDKGWDKDSGITMCFFEALAWIRWDDPSYLIDVKWRQINDYDSEVSYSGIKYQDWVVDEQGKFDIIRYASFIYNLPIRVCKDLNGRGWSKMEQCIEILDFCEKYGGIIARPNT